MSSDSLAILRNNASSDINELAQDHLKHDLTDSDRDALTCASKKMGTHITVGSAVGLSLGLLLAFRVRSARTKMFTAFRAAERPTHVQFKDGRVEPLPDITSVIKPSRLGDVAAYLLLGSGGLFVGGETGLLTGTRAASKTITNDPETRKRIEEAFARFRADMLRKQADALDGGQSLGIMFRNSSF